MFKNDQNKKLLDKNVSSSLSLINYRLNANSSIEQHTHYFLKSFLPIIISHIHTYIHDFIIALCIKITDYHFHYMPSSPLKRIIK